MLAIAAQRVHRHFALELVPDDVFRRMPVGSTEPRTTTPGIRHIPGRRLLDEGLKHLISSAHWKISLLAGPGSAALISRLTALIAKGTGRDELRVRIIARPEATIAPGQYDVRRSQRVLPGALLIVDDSRALLPLHSDPEAGYLEFRTNGTVDFLDQVFENHWLSSPSGESPAPVFTEEEHRILHLLGQGDTDEVIARRLGVTSRTVRRRVSAVMTRLGTTSRLQLGVVCARLNLM
ncbi:DNA-binding CsgD family transcriptional regulator [Nocardiopsis mwathae]|uniref:DNA-binding CsgD family transcriptional regulator n=1 Tax=Nocardiopsis mwathae TaxID=1472723 RepID=A0A7W9YM45_9ACTN|nr:helix-turn-helix transcriptional regulator [Nocardiopsis mwathae]MBB6174688.1 DNA-binding CsgD family transcriptional regulator [Nocardiopsis mwathae]